VRDLTERIRPAARGDSARRLTGLEKLALAGLVAIPFLMNAVTLLPELTIPAPSVNDDQYHYLFIQRASQALDDGESVIDHWLPQVETGVPQFLYYQHLPALVVVGVQRLSFGTMDLLTTFNLVRYILLIGFPFTVFVAMRLFGFSTVAAAMAAAASTLLSSDFRYGFEYDSYIFRGLGVFTQLFAMHLAFLTVAVAYRAFQLRKGLWIAAVLFGLLVLTHVFYAYMTAMAIGVMFLWGMNRSNMRARIWALGVVGAGAAVISSYMWWPFLTLSPWLNATPYLQPEKYDSYGAPTILGWIASGDYFDHGRLPVLTLLFALGVAAALLGRSRAALVTLALLLVWLVVYFGRPTLGSLVDLLPMHDGLLLHRFSGAVDLAAIILMGVGAAAIWELIRPQASGVLVVAASVLFIVVLAPAVLERADFYAANTRFLQRTYDAVAQDTDAQAVLARIESLPPDRTYAGLFTTYAKDMKFGDVYFYDLLTFHALDGFAPPNESISFNADFIWDFNENDPADYDLYNARYVVAPADRAMPAFLTPIMKTTKYTLYQAQTSGYAEYIAIGSRQAAATKNDLFQAARAWERSAPVGQDPPFIRFDYPATTVGPGPSSVPGCPDGGRTDFSAFHPGQIKLVVECPADSTLMVKTTFHPNWHVAIDGVDVPTFMVSPSYIGVSMPAGKHQVDVVYQATPIKTPLLVAGLIMLVLLLLVRGRLDGPRLPGRLGRRGTSTDPQLPEGGGLEARQAAELEI
jgi:hypothetical protein